MKMFYLINTRIPTEKAEGLEAMKLCESFSKLARVLFVMPRRFNPIKKDPFEFYRVQHKFKIVRLPVLDLVPLKHKIGFLIEAFSFSIVSFIYTLFKSKKDDVIFSHDHFALFFLSFVKKNVFYDIHDFPKTGFLYKKLIKNVKGIVTTNHWKKKKIVELFGVPEEKILVYPNGVDLDFFDIDISKQEARKRLNLPQNKPIVGYVGMLRTMGMEKGLDTAIECLEELPEDVLLVLDST